MKKYNRYYYNYIDICSNKTKNNNPFQYWCASRMHRPSVSPFKLRCHYYYHTSFHSHWGEKNLFDDDNAIRRFEMKKKETFFAGFTIGMMDSYIYIQLTIIAKIIIPMEKVFWNNYLPTLLRSSKRQKAFWENKKYIILMLFFSRDCKICYSNIYWYMHTHSIQISKNVHCVQGFIPKL